MDYKNAGVDIEAGYKSVELMKEHVKKTMRPEVLGGLGGFSGAFSLAKIKEMEEPVLLSGTDGCGTKVKLAMILDKHDTIGIDAVAMCVNDIACAGGEPLFFLDYIACGKNYPETGLFLSPYFWWIDSVLGMLISFMLFYAAYGIIREAVNKILGEEPSEEVIGKVEQIVKAEMGNVAYPHHYHIHHYGDHIEFTFHIKVPGEETVEEAHRKATLIEMQIKTELKIDATIHIEPLKM